MFAVDTQKRLAVERHTVHKLHKGLVQLVHAVVVGVHVVGVDIGHHGNHGREIQERGVRFVGLGHNILPAAELGVGARSGELAADNEGRVEAGGGEDGGSEAGGGGFAVRTGNGDALAEAHNLRQHHGARNHRNACLAGSQHFRIVRLDGGGGNHHVHALDVLCRMAVEYLDAHIGQLARYRALRLIRAGYVEFFIQHLG